MTDSKDPFEDYKEFIPEYDGFVEALKQPLPVHIRVNRLKARPEQVLRELAGEKIALRRTHPADDALYDLEGTTNPGNLLHYFLGAVHPQALTSCLPAKALAPRPGAFVLDMCAAPGGKTAQISEIMCNSGLVVANDLHAGRHLALSHNLIRMGIVNTIITAYQAQEFPLRERFHYVLADVPCSGEGVFRKMAEGRRFNTGPGSGKLPELQTKILARGFELLERGGTLVYSTCTYNPEENEAVVDCLLKSREDAEILSLDPGIPCAPGLGSWRKIRYDPTIERTVRFYPHQVDSVGFFMARIGKRN